jgi:hypothetical protein
MRVRGDRNGGKMQPNPHYRYIRSLGCGASLFSVTEPGIDEFLEAPDAGHPGLVVLALDGSGEAAPQVRFLGGPRVRDAMRRLQAPGAPDLGEARPLAVVSVEVAADESWVGARLADALRTRHEAARRRDVPPAGADLGRFASLEAAAAEAVAHVLGIDPFEPPPPLN